MQFSGLRSWERVPAWIPFSNSLQWLFSALVTLYVLDYPFCCNWWNCIWNGWVIILLKIYKHAFVLIKYPCSTRDLGPLRPSFCLHSLRSMEAYRAHILARAFKTSLRRHPVPSWVVQALWMGFIGFPRNSRDTALSLSFSLFLFINSGPHVPVYKRPQQVAPEQGHGIHSIIGRSDWDLLRLLSTGLRDKWLESPTIFLSKWWKTILTVIIIVILFLLFAFYICNHIMS